MFTTVVVSGLPVSTMALEVVLVHRGSKAVSTLTSGRWKARRRVGIDSKTGG